jgi:hypothetical protein
MAEYGQEFRLKRGKVGGGYLGSHPQANIDEMLVPREFPRDFGRARRVVTLRFTPSLFASLTVQAHT